MGPGRCAGIPRRRRLRPERRAQSLFAASTFQHAAHGASGSSLEACGEACGGDAAPHGERRAQDHPGRDGCAGETRESLFEEFLHPKAGLSGRRGAPGRILDKAFFSFLPKFPCIVS